MKQTIKQLEAEMKKVFDGRIEVSFLGVGKLSGWRVYFNDKSTESTLCLSFDDFTFSTVCKKVSEHRKSWMNYGK
jgi:hypothetical protein